MGVNYRPLWIELAKRQMKKTEFQEVAGISSNLVAKMGKNEYISMKNLEKICRTMNLSPCVFCNNKIQIKEENNCNIPISNNVINWSSLKNSEVYSLAH